MLAGLKANPQLSGMFDLIDNLQVRVQVDVRLVRVPDHSVVALVKHPSTSPGPS
jgi:hypothetical protein